MNNTNTKHFPLVSVVVVCYNHEKYVEECINSVVKQSYPNIQLIVFDNNSKDNSKDIIGELANRYNFIFEQQKNIYLPATINKALKKYVKGKYVSILSADDFWPLNKIEIGVNFMENCDLKIAVCGGNVLKIDEKSNIYKRQNFYKYHELTFEDAFIHFKHIPALTALIRTEVIFEVDMYDTNIMAEDILMWLKIMHRGYRIAYLNNLQGFYRYHDSNISHTREGKVETLSYMINRFKDHPEYQKALSNMHFNQFSHYSKIDKLYALRFLKYYNIKFISLKKLIYSLIVFLLPVKFLLKRIKVM